MSIKLSDKERCLFENAKDFALKNISPYSYQWENGEKTSLEAMNLFSENGYCSIGVSKKLGGKGYNFLESALIYEGLAHGDAALSSSVIQLHNNIVYMLAKFYTKNEFVRDIFSAIVSGQKRLAFAITEKHSGSDPSSMKSYAELRHDGYHLHGKKSWIFNSMEADYFVTTVKNGSPNTKNMLMFLVDRNTTGFAIGKNSPRIGNNCISCCNLHFDDCIISKDRLITEKGFSEALSFIDLPRIFVPSIAIGMSERIIDITMQYLNALNPISKINILNNGVQQTIFKLLAQVEAGRWLVYRTASKMDKLEPIKVQSAMNKYFATEVAMNTISSCLQLVGENDNDILSVLSRYFSIAKLLQIVDGTSEIQKIIIGRNLETQVN